MKHGPCTQARPTAFPPAPDPAPTVTLLSAHSLSEGGILVSDAVVQAISRQVFWLIQKWAMLSRAGERAFHSLAHRPISVSSGCLPPLPSFCRTHKLTFAADGYRLAGAVELPYGTSFDVLYGGGVIEEVGRGQQGHACVV